MRVNLILLGWLALQAGAAGAQSVPRVVPGWGVDTTTAAWSDLNWHGAVAEIYRAWSRYLLGNPQLQAPTTLWSASEQRQWRSYDLTAGIAYKGFGATVVDIRPAQPGRTDEFIVKTLFASASTEGAVRPTALTRVYAIREGGRWVFANALPRLTHNWQRIALGPFTYVLPPGRPLDRKRAARAVAFADSLAAAFRAPRIDRLTYYVGASPEALHRIMGVDWTFGAMGYGYAMTGNQLILSGDPVFAEENRHELAHIVLSPLVTARTHAIIGEGMATRFGGSVSRYLPALLDEYAVYLKANPSVTLDTILQGSAADQGWSPAGAILVLMVQERAASGAVLDLLASGRSDDELRSTLVRLLGVPWPAVMARWHMRALSGAVPDR